MLLAQAGWAGLLAQVGWAASQVVVKDGQVRAWAGLGWPASKLARCPSWTVGHDLTSLELKPAYLVVPAPAYRITG